MCYHQSYQLGLISTSCPAFLSSRHARPHAVFYPSFFLSFFIQVPQQRMHPLLRGAVGEQAGQQVPALAWQACPCPESHAQRAHPYDPFSPTFSI